MLHVTAVPVRTLLLDVKLRAEGSEVEGLLSAQITGIAIVNNLVRSALFLDSAIKILLLQPASSVCICWQTLVFFHKRNTVTNLLCEHYSE